MSNDNDQNVNTVDNKKESMKKDSNRPNRKGKGNRQQKGGVDAKSLFGQGSFSSIKIDEGGLTVVHRLPSDPRLKLEESISLGGVSLDPQVIALVKALNQMLRPGFDPNRKTPIRKDGELVVDENGKPVYNPSVADILIARLKDPSWLQDDKGEIRNNDAPGL